MVRKRTADVRRDEKAGLDKKAGRTREGNRGKREKWKGLGREGRHVYR